MLRVNNIFIQNEGGGGLSNMPPGHTPDLTP